ncbi:MULTISPECIES: glycosyltransferase family 4 protein [unclassified Pseudoalteromonas]|uniref:glycosyltransferase family 4 protein n=1 Tax=unclassified Pseudoalteromonas TaxID=194690 RepID=UPI0007E52681|nr:MULTISPECIES: glycosyltransferase family 4 protein [unclassified Pseudoalteromonas]MDN3490859.1 glycosyltransferase family 4 protein [Pseudoalteromonas sp. APC 3694]
MKVLFKNRFDAFTSVGGDTVQMLNTKRELEALGIEVDIDLGITRNVKQYDIVHVFNLMRSYEGSLAIWQAKAASVPVVYSSIYWDFSEFNKVGRQSQLHNFLHEHFSEFTVEKFKESVRGIREGNALSYTRYMLSTFKKTLEEVDLFLPNSVNEGELIRTRILPNAQYHVVHNAVDSGIFNLQKGQARNQKALTVARLDPRKNVDAIIKSKLLLEVDIFGAKAPNHSIYYDKLLESKPKNISFKGAIDNAELATIYNRYSMHILPSWLETPGLSQLEAAACGCNIVSTDRGSASEYFGAFAEYCDPSKPETIKHAVERVINNTREPKAMSEFVLDNYTWKKTAAQTLMAYKSVLGEK